MHTDETPWVPPNVNPADPMGFWQSTQDEVHVRPKRTWVGTTPPAASDAAYLTRLLGIAARHRSRPPDAYVDYFALSARSWAQSSRRNVFAIFGRDENLRTCPPSGPRFGDAAPMAVIELVE